MPECFLQDHPEFQGVLMQSQPICTQVGYHQ